MSSPTPGGDLPHKEAIAALIVLVLVLGVGAVVLVGFFGGGHRPQQPRAGHGGHAATATSPPPPPTTRPPTLVGKPDRGGGLKLVMRRFPLRVTTANIHAGMPWPRAAADLRRVARQGTDVVGLNEVTPGRAGQIAAWARGRPGWHYWAPSPARSRWQYDDTILWNSANLRLLDAGSVWASPSRTRYRIDSRWIAWAEFEHKPSGTHVYYLQTHMDPAVERGGHPRRKPTVGANLTYMHKLLQVAGGFARDGVVVIGGDWNVNARADMRVQAGQLPYAVLQGRGKGPIVTNYEALGFTIPPTSPESGRWIDYLAIWDRFLPGGPELRFAKQYSDTGVNSDHDPVTADLTLRVPTLMGLDRFKRSRG